MILPSFFQHDARAFHQLGQAHLGLRPLDPGVGDTGRRPAPSAISQLPRGKQRVVVEVLDRVLAPHGA